MTMQAAEAGSRRERWARYLSDVEAYAAVAQHGAVDKRRRAFAERADRFDALARRVVAARNHAAHGAARLIDERVARALQSHRLAHADERGAHIGRRRALIMRAKERRDARHVRRHRGDETDVAMRGAELAAQSRLKQPSHVGGRDQRLRAQNELGNVVGRKRLVARKELLLVGLHA